MLSFLDCERNFSEISLNIFWPCFVNIERTILRRKKFPKNCKFHIIWSLSEKFVDFRWQKSRQVRQNCVPCEQGNAWTKTRSEEKVCMSNNLVSGKFFRLLPNFRQEDCQNCILKNRRINLINHVWRKNNYFYHFGFRTNFFLLLTFWWEKFSLLCEVCVLITAPKRFTILVTLLNNEVYKVILCITFWKRSFPALRCAFHSGALG